MGWRINSEIVLPVSGLAFPRGGIGFLGSIVLSLVLVRLVWVGRARGCARLRLELGKHQLRWGRGAAVGGRRDGRRDGRRIEG